MSKNLTNENIVAEYEVNDTLFYKVVQHSENLFSVIKVDNGVETVVQPNHDAIGIIRYLSVVAHGLYHRLQK